jgi:DNA-binding MarR family transcriptional regulator
MIDGSMPGMATVEDAPLPSTTAFLLGTVGAVVAQRFADRIAPLDLKPKHVGLLAVLNSGQAASQLDIATALGVVPSLIVRLADHLEHAGAVERARDPGDRRRQTLRLTDRGHALLAECVDITRSLEAEILAGLRATDRAALRSALRRVAGNLGLPEV